MMVDLRISFKKFIINIIKINLNKKNYGMNID